MLPSFVRSLLLPFYEQLLVLTILVDPQVSTMEAAKFCVSWLWIIFAFFSFVYMVQDFTCIFWIASLLNKPVLEDKSPKQLSPARSQHPFVLACWFQHESLTSPLGSP